MPNYSFKDAAAVRLSFGKHKGRSLDEIASTDEGLRYLDWLVEEKIYDKWLRAALDIYMDDPAIKKELEDL